MRKGIADIRYQISDIKGRRARREKEGRERRNEEWRKKKEEEVWKKGIAWIAFIARKHAETNEISEFSELSEGSELSEDWEYLKVRYGSAAPQLFFIFGWHTPRPQQLRSCYVKG